MAESRHQNRAQKSTRPDARDGPAAARKRLLIVDDAEGIRTYLAHLLEVKGFDVDTAEDGRSALALLEGGAAPDAVLLDIMMPGIDGIETLRRIRAFNDGPARGDAERWSVAPLPLSRRCSWGRSTF